MVTVAEVVTAAVAAPVVSAEVVEAVTGAAVAVAAVEAGIADYHAELQGLSVDPLVRASGTLGLNSMALFILNTHPKNQKLRIPHGYRTYSLHHQA